jgi:hypothetical protein
MPCINFDKQLYLQTYDRNNPNLIVVQSSTAVQYMHRIEQKFFYIQFSDAESFALYPLSSIIDSDILESMRTGDVYLMVDNALEYQLNTVERIYSDIVIRERIPAGKIIFLSGVPTMIEQVRNVAKKLNLPEIRTEWFSLFEETGLHAVRKNNYGMHTLRKKKNWNKKYLCLNRRWRLHRPMMVAMLHGRNLLQHGHVSLAPSDTPHMDSWDSALSQLQALYPDDEMFRNEAIRKLPHLYLDTKDLKTNRAEYEDSILPYYEDTFFSVVNETTYFENIPFLSEKIFKVIAMGHPFILSSSPNTMQYLHQLGYRTFHPIIDESYDGEVDHRKRMLMIVDEIEKLCRMDKGETAAFLSKIRPIVKHNFRNLKKKTSIGISRTMN